MIRLAAAAATDPGLERETNEDSAYAQVVSASGQEPLGLFIVCDGMGGHLGGECASFWAVETIKQELAGFLQAQDPNRTASLSGRDPDPTLSGEASAGAPSQVEDQTLTSPLQEMELHIRRAVQRANQVVYEYATRNPETAAGAGTTLNMVLVRGRRAVIANVGDSRTYMLRSHNLNQITRDHSLVATLAAAGQIRPEEIFSHPQRNIIYRSLGQKEEIPVDIFVVTLQAGDALLLCSDGLWEMVREVRILAHLIEKAEEPQLACEALVKAARQAGGEDNIGVVVVKVAEDGLVQEAP
jgi:serine/threonine protein phosphatase PrpC